MITQLSIAHFKAIASATIPLGPITVLVGPNDSGKSTILQALQAVSLAASPLRLHAERVLGCTPALAATNGDVATNISISVEGDAPPTARTVAFSYRYRWSVSPASGQFVHEELRQDENVVLSAQIRQNTVLHGARENEPWTGSRTELSDYAHSRWRADSLILDLTSLLLRLESRAIMQPAQLGVEMQASGAGLVGLVDELLTSGLGDDQIARINGIIRTLSPHVKGIATRLHPSGGKELHFALRSGTVIPASQVSDWIVLAATLAVLSTRANTTRLLVEEPENGLHPRQLKIVADTIRAISQAGTQVVLTTHSPLLLNHFAAEEVVLVTRTSAGVQAQRMSDAREVKELASEMALGELWYNVGDQNLARPA